MKRPHLFASSIDDLCSITDTLHDKWFSVNDIEYDKMGHSVSILFTGEELINRRISSSLKDNPAAGCVLVENVQEIIVKDTERITWYDFNYVGYDSRHQVIFFRTNIPIVLKMRVSKISIRVMDTKGS